MNALQMTCKTAPFHETGFQLRMQTDELSQRKAGLFRSFDEVLVTWEPVVNRTGIGREYHPAARFLEPITQLDILHPVDLESFVEPAHIQKHLSRGRYVAGVVVGKI